MDVFSQQDYEKLIDQKIKETKEIMEEAEKKYLEAKAKYEASVMQKELFEKWVKEEGKWE